uniref:Uncharacterized protein n=1 Tax=Cacopsylla melanoneura TaxID=428564 RepID=A0A8D9ALA3_9HEMI
MAEKKKKKMFIPGFRMPKLLQNALFSFKIENLMSTNMPRKYTVYQCLICLDNIQSNMIICLDKYIYPKTLITNAVLPLITLHLPCFPCIYKRREYRLYLEEKTTIFLVSI